jgi:uncharacterized membrane protein
MEKPMRDLMLQTAGVLGILVGIVHGVLGETKVFAAARIEPDWVRRLLRAVWAAGAVAWIGGGVLLLAAPSMSSETARQWIVAVLAVVYGCGALGNAWVTRGRHPGWMLLTATIGLALAGL